MHGTLLVFFVLLPVVTGLATYLVPLMIGARAIAHAGHRGDRPLALRVRRRRRRALGLRGGRRLAGGLDGLPAARDRPAGKRRRALADGLVAARDLAPPLGDEPDRDDSRAANGRRWDGRARRCSPGRSTSGRGSPSCSCRSPRSGSSSSFSSASSPGSFDFFLDGDTVEAEADLALRPVIRLCGARSGLRDPRRDRGRVRRQGDRERTRARPGTRRHRWPDDPPRALPRLLDRNRQEAERGAAAPRDRRDDPVRRRDLGCSRAPSGSARASLRWTAPLLFAGGAIVLFGIGLLSRARPRHLRQRSRPPRNRVRRRPRSLSPLGHGAPRDCSAASSTGGRRSSVGCSARRLTRWSAILLFVGFNCTFFVQFLLGDQGQARGASSFSAHGSTAAYNMISTIGAFVTALGGVFFLLAVLRARQRQARRQRPVASRTRSSGTRPRRRRRTTSTRSRRSRARGRSSTCARLCGARNAL